MARTKVQSDKAKGKVAKLSYQINGPVRILQYTGQCCYLVQQYGKPMNSEVKYMAE